MAPYNIRTSLFRVANTHPAVRNPAWRWSFVLSAYLNQTVKLLALQKDRTVQKWSKWYRDYMKDCRFDRSSVEEQVYNLYITDRPFSRRWMIEALLATGESPKTISDRFEGTTPEIIALYSDMFFDVSRITGKKYDIVSGCLAWCSSRQWDLPWKLHAIEHGADVFLKMVGSPALCAADAVWFRDVVRKKIALEAVSGAGFWDESMSRLSNDAARWLDTSEGGSSDSGAPDHSKDRVLDLLSHITVQLQQTRIPETREFVKIPQKIKSA